MHWAEKKHNTLVSDAGYQVELITCSCRSRIFAETPEGEPLGTCCTTESAIQKCEEHASAQGESDE